MPFGTRLCKTGETELMDEEVLYTNCRYVVCQRQIEKTSFLVPFSGRCCKNFALHLAY